jgi:hypothetical protein
MRIQQARRKLSGIEFNITHSPLCVTFEIVYGKIVIKHTQVKIY